MEELVLIVGGKRKAVAKLKRVGEKAELEIKVIKCFDGDRLAVRLLDENAVEIKNSYSEKMPVFKPFALFIGNEDDYSFGVSKGYSFDTSDPFKEIKEKEQKIHENDIKDKNDSVIRIDNTIGKEIEDSKEDKDTEENTDRNIGEKAEETIEEMAEEEDINNESDDEPIGFEGEIASINYYKNELPTCETAKDVIEYIKGEKSEEKSMENNSYYLEIKKSLDDLFERFPQDEYLCETIPSSHWVKIDYDGNGKSYSVGVLTDGEEVVYIGYGIRAHFSKTLPSSIKSVAQWVPLDFSYPKGEGYFMIYQKASDGSNV